MTTTCVPPKYSAISVADTKGRVVATMVNPKCTNDRYSIHYLGRPVYFLTRTPRKMRKREAKAYARRLFKEKCFGRVVVEA